MSIKIKNFLLSILLLAVSIPAVFYIIVFYGKYENKKYYTRLRHDPKVFVYDTIWWKSTGGPLDGACYIDDLKYKNGLLYLYKGEEHGKRLPMYFPVQYMPIKTSVILLGYTKDSIFAEVVDFDTTCWGHIQGWVYYKNVHKNSPPDSLLKKFYALFKNQKPDQIAKPPSLYGCQCW